MFFGEKYRKLQARIDLIDKLAESADCRAERLSDLYDAQTGRIKELKERLNMALKEIEELKKNMADNQVKIDRQMDTAEILDEWMNGERSGGN